MGVIVLDPQIGRFPSAGPAGTLRPEIGPPNRLNCKRNWPPERSGTLRNALAGFGAPNRPNCKRNWRSERSGTLRVAPAGFGDPNRPAGGPAGPAALRPEIGPPNRPNCKWNWR